MIELDAQFWKSTRDHENESTVIFKFDASNYERVSAIPAGEELKLVLIPISEIKVNNNKEQIEETEE